MANEAKSRIKINPDFAIAKSARKGRVSQLVAMRVVIQPSEERFAGTKMCKSCRR